MTDDQIIDGILDHEGGFVDNPFDRGGPTKYGITLTTLSRWRGKDQTREDVKELTVYEAREIYRHLYLTPFDGVDPELKPQVVDIAVNSGVGRARALLAQAQQQTKRPVGVQLVIERLEFYARIVKSDPTQATFLTGWIRRATSFLVLVLLGGCAMNAPVAIWHRNVPTDWTPPKQYANCQLVEETVLEDGSANGLDTIWLTCPDRTVFVTTQTKRTVWSVKR